MQTARRNFLKYTSIVGFMSISLFGAMPKYEVEEIGATHMDADFDPDSWL